MINLSDVGDNQVSRNDQVTALGAPSSDGYITVVNFTLFTLFHRISCLTCLRFAFTKISISSSGLGLPILLLLDLVNRTTHNLHLIDWNIQIK